MNDLTQADMEQAGFTKDFAGVGGHTRYTHSDLGITVLRQPFMTGARWQEEMANGLKRATLGSGEGEV